MALGQSPPTTSGLVVITGSHFFDPQSSDFPVVVATVDRVDKRGAGPVLASVTFDDLFDLVRTASVISVDKRGIPDTAPALGVVLTIGADIEIRSTPVTTSGVVIMEMFTGVGGVFVVPVVGNIRVFPIFQGVFPEQDRRVFPRLPQSSILTPGD